MDDFTEFIRCHRQKLLGIAVRICHGSQDAEDLVQETLVRAMANYSQVSKLAPNAQRSWLAKTLSRIFIDMYRRRQKEELLADPQLLEAHDCPWDPETRPPWESTSPEDLRRAIEQLPLFLAVPFRLRHAGHSYKSIAQQLQTSEGTVASWLFQARKQLRAILMFEEVHP
jgi:RNA polymerase sigma-70 factor (ECF subfamily)